MEVKEGAEDSNLEYETVVYMINTGQMFAVLCDDEKIISSSLTLYRAGEETNECGRISLKEYL